MENTNNTNRTLLNEIEDLQVLESQQLQEGVAFHAFRFKLPWNEENDG